MTGHRSGLDGTRDVDRSPAEQQDRLGEQLGSLPCDRVRPSPVVDHGEERLQCSRTLVRIRSGREQGRQVLLRERGTSSTDEDPEANQEALLRGRAANQDGPMPIEHRQVEDPLDQSSDPLANAGPGDGMAASHRCDRLALVDFFHRPQDGPYAMDLARKQIEGQNTFARPASRTPRQPDAESLIASGRLGTSLHPAVGQHELVAAAPSADATAKNRLLRTRQNSGVAGTIHDKYVDQTAYLEDGSGDLRQQSPGPSSFLVSELGGYGGKDTGGKRSEAMGCDSQKARFTTRSPYRAARIKTA